MAEPLPLPQTDRDSEIFRACPGCGGKIVRPLGDLRFQMFDGSPLSGNFRLGLCEECGLAFHDTRNLQEDFDRYYRESGYYQTAVTIGSGGGTLEDERRYREVVRRLRPHLSGPDAVILDIGCGKGGLLQALAREGFRRVSGVDMLPACVAYVREKSGLPAHTGSALDLPFPELKADALVYSHVVEHLFDLRTMLDAAREKLNPGGRVYVEVPDAPRYRDCSIWPYQELYLEHINHFDLHALLNLFGCAGFIPLAHGTDTIQTAPSRRAPCLWAVFGLGDGLGPQVRRPALGAALADYLAWSESHPIMAGLDRLASRPEGMYLWGLSQWAMLVLGHSPKIRKTVRGFVDRDEYKQTRTLIGHPIRPPESLRSRGDRAGILVTALGVEDSIRSAAKEMGIKGPIWTPEGAVDHDQV